MLFLIVIVGHSMASPNFRIFLIKYGLRAMDPGVYLATLYIGEVLPLPWKNLLPPNQALLRGGTHQELYRSHAVRRLTWFCAPTPPDNVNDVNVYCLFL